MAHLSGIRALFAAAAPLPIASGYRMQAKGRTAEIILYGDVGESWFGGVTAKQFADDLKALGTVDTINVRINSAGGDVFDGLTIYRRLVDHPARIVTFVDGVAASIASVIAMAGSEIHISASGFMMIHNAWGIAIGTADDIRTTADLLDTTSASIRDVYVSRTGQGADQVAEWMDQETWFTADDAVKYGFATDKVENMQLAARVDPSKHRFRRTPVALTSTPNLDAMRQRLAGLKAKMDRRRVA